MFFWPKLAQKLILGLEFWNSNSGFGISSSKIPCVLIFRQSRQFWIFRPKFAQKWILGLEFRKSKSGSRISTSKIPWTPTFSQKNNIEFFGLNLGKLLDYMWHFGSNMLRVLQKAGWTLKWAGWRWMELGVDGWSWVELGAWFSNALLKNVAPL